MANNQGFNHQVRRAASLTLALVACLAFGIVVLANSDWVPGGSSLQRRLSACRGRSP